MRPGRRKSVLQERRIAEDIGGRVQPGSGAPAFYKSDAVAGLDLRVEAKTTSKESYTLTTAVIDKIRNEALSGGQEDWAMQIEFQGRFSHKRVAVIDWDRFLDLKTRSVELQGVKDELSLLFKTMKAAEKLKKEAGEKPDEALSKEDCG